jgi:hypothetical protein
MMISTRLICGAVLGFLAASGAHSQPVTILDCEFNRLIGNTPPGLEPRWAAIYPGARFGALRRLMQSGRWVEVVDSVRASYDVFAASESPTPDGGPLGRVRLQLDSARARVDLLVHFTADVGDARQVGPAIFQAPPRQGTFTFFPGTPSEVVIDTATPSGVRRTICYHAALARAVLDSFTISKRAAASDLLSGKRKAWENYFANGYSQLPWELAVNSRKARKADELDPPLTQLILLHPVAAVEVAGPNYKDLASHDAIDLEVLGKLWYADNARFDKYFGVSGAVVFTNDLGTGVAPIVHFGSTVKLGYVWPVRRVLGQAGPPPQGIIMNVDLYKFLVNHRGQAEKTLNAISAALQRK